MQSSSGQQDTSCSSQEEKGQTKEPSKARPLPTDEHMTITKAQRRKELFGDCALIEIIHLHDCLRGALKALETDVRNLEQAIHSTSSQALAELERRVAGRFKVIWSVFRAHSQAEDEFIWPALQKKTQGQISGSHSPKYNNSHPHQNATTTANTANNKSDQEVIEQEEYEEDHASEERMFSEMDTLLTSLRNVLVAEKKQKDVHNVDRMAHDLSVRTETLSQHLMAHLEKEETQCMPLVVKHLTKSEIHELVGNIMGKRSADTIANIMTMAVQSLDDADREEMVRYMKQSMAGTFFDRWLLMSGWMASSKGAVSTEEESVARKRDATEDVSKNEDPADAKRVKQEDTSIERRTKKSRAVPPVAETTSQAELEKLIRAVASNPALTPAQKNTTIQGLRDSVWKSNQRERQRHIEEQPTRVNESIHVGPSFPLQTMSTVATASDSTAGASAVSSARSRRVTPPAMYYKKSTEGTVRLVWNSDGPGSSRVPDDGSVPLFSAAELAPTYHDGAAMAVLGCPHYSRACKLRHPKSGRLYTCRLCCEQQRELPMSDQDEPLDRYEVREVMCMKCNTLQPAEDRCINADCESRGKPFAKYFCRICHLYDDGSRPIFHCPYCNTCRLGLGLGIDFRHCMRCNACVSLEDNDHHCIPQKLQGDCPICHDSLFQSTEPLRGLKCGHVMHLSCFTDYRRGHSYTCPLCMRSMEDMKDYFAILDSAVRMQPMPTAYLNTMSNIYCQDCCKTGQCPYHFVGQKCPHCGSYNTREMGRVHNAPSQNT